MLQARLAQKEPGQPAGTSALALDVGRLDDRHGHAADTTVHPDLEKRIEQGLATPDTIQGVVPDAVVLSSDSTRLALHRLLPGVTILARSEVPEGVQLKSVGTLRVKNWAVKTG